MEEKQIKEAEFIDNFAILEELDKLMSAFNSKFNQGMINLALIQFQNNDYSKCLSTNLFKPSFTKAQIAIKPDNAFELQQNIAKQYYCVESDEEEEEEEKSNKIDQSENKTLQETIFYQFGISNIYPALYQISNDFTEGLKIIVKIANIMNHIKQKKQKSKN